MKTYQLSATGRRNVMLLMIGAGLIWIFAIWTFQSTLAISYSPGKILDSLQASLGQGLTIVACTSLWAGRVAVVCGD